jgi:hypothetical protein
MKKKRIIVLMALLTFFSILSGASLKVWGYSMYDEFLMTGLISFVITIILAIPKDNSSLDNWI